MSTPSRYQRWRQVILQGRLGYTEQPEPDPNPEDPIDYASLEQAGAIQVAIAETTFGELLEGETVTSDQAGTPSNSNDRDYETASIRASGAEGSPISWYWAVDFGSALEVTSYDIDDPIGSEEWRHGSGFTNTVEFSDNGSSWTSTAYTYSTSTVSTGLAFPLPTTTTRHTYDLDTPSTHRYWRIRQSVGSGFHLESGMSEWYIYGSASTGEKWVPGPGANDGDDATYAFSDALIDDATARIALEVARLIYRAEVRVGTETSGSHTYSVYGSDDVSFTSPVLLDSNTFTATGSFTAQEISFAWTPEASYQFYEIRDATDEERRFYDINLYSAIGAGFGVTDHSALDGLTPNDDHTQYVLTTEGGREPVVSHGTLGAAENIDPSGGNAHVGTLDQDCTITLLPPATDRANALTEIEVEIVEDADGGWTPTFAASGGSIVWAGGSAPEHDTTALSSTIYVFRTRDDGVTWRGFVAGGSGGSIAIDDGSTTVDPVTDLTVAGTGLAEVSVTDDTGGAATLTVDVTLTEEAVQAVGHYELLMTGSGPPEPLEDGTGTDWLYVWVNG